jgi:pimeloyl-ACP methyl ester carboxylesterase
VHYPALPVRLLLRDRWPVAERVARVDAPTTVVWGSADRVIPPAQSAAVAAAAAGRPVRTVVVPGADHNDQVLLDGPELVAAVVALADPATG